MRAGMHPQARLAIREVTAGYPGREEPVLTKVSLNVRGGELVVLAGPNGCGKTSLLRAATGMLVPLSGSVAAMGRPEPMHTLPPETRARLVAVVSQSAQLPAGYSAFEAVMLGRIAFHGWFGPESQADRAIVTDALRSVGLEAEVQAPLETLSGGAQQRVLIARTLAQEAPILLMDEPTAHLDLHFQLEILVLLRRLARKAGRAVLVVLHDLNLAARFADRIALMEHGRLIACGKPASILTEERLSRLYGLPLNVFPHPQHGYPMVFPDGGKNQKLTTPRVHAVRRKSTTPPHSGGRRRARR